MKNSFSTCCHFSRIRIRNEFRRINEKFFQHRISWASKRLISWWKIVNLSDFL
jgi:hypothetical protein